MLPSLSSFSSKYAKASAAVGHLGRVGTGVGFAVVGGMVGTLVGERDVGKADGG